MDVMLKEKAQQDIERLDERGLKEVADFMAFLHFRARQSPAPDQDDAQLAAGLVREDAAA